MRDSLRFLANTSAHDDPVPQSGSPVGTGQTFNQIHQTIPSVSTP
jgi:hypothetical protein